MNYKIVYPFMVDIYGDNFKEAIKNYVKLNYNRNIHNIIIQDQAAHYEARFNYFKNNNKTKIGIDIYPYMYPNQNLFSQMMPNPILPIIPNPILPILPNQIISNSMFSPLIKPIHVRNVLD